MNKIANTTENIKVYSTFLLLCYLILVLLCYAIVPRDASDKPNRIYVMFLPSIFTIVIGLIFYPILFADPFICYDHNDYNNLDNNPDNNLDESAIANLGECDEELFDDV